MTTPLFQGQTFVTKLTQLIFVAAQIYEVNGKMCLSTGKIWEVSG